MGTNKDKTMNDYLNLLFWIVIVVLLLTISGLEIYNATRPHTPDVYKFEVTGVISEANATTAASLHLECIKYCVDRTTNDYGSRDKCYAACQTIGKELD